MTLSPCTDSSVEQPIDALLALPDPEAAEALQGRLRAWDELEKRVSTYSFVERGQIVIAFERRMLWHHLTDPSTGQPFVSFPAWMRQSALGCRSTNYEAKRDLEELRDVPPAKLLAVPKANIKILKQLSGSVRKQDDVLEAAKTLSTDEFKAKIETDHPLQHIETTAPMRFTPSASQREVIDRALEKAIADGAHDRTEALEYVCQDYLLERLEAEAAEVPA